MREELLDRKDLGDEAQGPGAEDEVLVVDIGGGHDHDLQRFVTKSPDARGRVVNQDLPLVLAEIPSAAPGNLDPKD